MSRRTTRLLLIAAPLAVVAVVASFALVIVARAQRQAGTYSSSSPDFGHAPSYTLTDQNGRRVPSSTFDGKVQVVTYLFPYCTTYCPAITHTLVELRKDLRQEGLYGGRVRFVAFNVDPTGSGPAEMRTFLRQYGVDPRDAGWSFLTGSAAQIATVVRGGYHVYYSKVSDAEEERQIAKEKADGRYTPAPEHANPLAKQRHIDYDVVHNDYVEIVGPDGRILQFYNGDQVSEARLFAAVRQIAVAGH